MVHLGDKVVLKATGATYRVGMIKLDENRHPLAYFLEPSASMDAWVHLLPLPPVVHVRAYPNEIALTRHGQTQWLPCPWCEESHNHWCAINTLAYTFCTNCRGAQKVP